MSKKKVDFNVKASAGVQDYWIAVDADDVTLVNGKGSIRLAPGDHLLHWGFSGTSGTTLAITGEVSNSIVVEVKASSIPPNSGVGGGVKRFTVGG